MPFTHNCQQCAKSFQTKQRLFNGKTPMFCSNVCKFASYRVRPLAIDCICPNCGLAFSLSTAKLALAELAMPQHYCSISCATIDRKRPTMEERFWEYTIVPINPDACWTWIGHLDGKGYGSLYWKRAENGSPIAVRAHRFSFELHYGPIPTGLHGCHSCDNPRCVNPEHLFIGTQQDNMNDMMNKGRGRSG